MPHRNISNYVFPSQRGIRDILAGQGFRLVEDGAPNRYSVVPVDSIAPLLKGYIFGIVSCYASRVELNLPPAGRNPLVTQAQGKIREAILTAKLEEQKAVAEITRKLRDRINGR